MSAANPQPPSERRALWIVGCGDLGAAVGHLALADGWDVFATRRRADRIPDSFHPCPGDVSSTDPGALTAPARCDALLYSVAASERSDEGYAVAYRDGLARTLKALSHGGLSPDRALFVSSTSVWKGEGGVWIDELTPARPGDGPPARILEAEQLLARSFPPAVCTTSARLGGIYGPGRTALIREAARRRSSQPDAEPPDLYTNRIHRDDAARALWHLLTHAEPPELVAVVDDHPSLRSVVLDYVGEQLEPHLAARSKPDVEASPSSRTTRPRANRRISNRLLRSTGFDLRYPSYREGYAALLESAEDVEAALDESNRRSHRGAQQR